MSLLVFNFEDKRFRFVLDYCVNILIVQSNIQVEKIEWNTSIKYGSIYFYRTCPQPCRIITKNYQGVIDRLQQKHLFLAKIQDLNFSQLHNLQDESSGSPDDFGRSGE